MPKSTVASKRGVVDVARELESIRSYYLAVKDKIAQQPEFMHPSIELLYTEINKLTARSLEVTIKVCDDLFPSAKLCIIFPVLFLFLQMSEEDGKLKKSTSEFTIGMY